MSARKPPEWSQDSIGGWVHDETKARVWEATHEAHVGKWYWRTQDGKRQNYEATRAEAMTAALKATIEEPAP